jgi:REP element-mobilizing transposase RayT
MDRNNGTNTPKPRYQDKYRVESTRLPGWNYATNGGYFVTICTDNQQCFLGEIVAGEMRLSQAGKIAHKLWPEIPERFPNCQLDVFCVMPNHIHGILITCDRPRHVNSLRGEGEASEKEKMNRDGLRHNGLRHDGLRHNGLRHDGLRHDGLRHDGLRHDGLGGDAINRVSTRKVGNHRNRGGVTGEFNPMLSKDSLSKIIRWYKGRCKFEINRLEETRSLAFPYFAWQERFHDEIIRDEQSLHQIRQYIVYNPIKWECDDENPSHTSRS